MNKVATHKIFDGLMTDADLARIILPHAAVLAPILVAAIDQATDAMIAAHDLPEPAIEALDDLGHFLTRAASEMFEARSQLTDEPHP